MKKRIFLIGKEGCGKSLLIRSALGLRMQNGGGLVCEKRFSEDGKIIGDYLLTTAMAAGVEGFSAERFLDLSLVPAKSDNEVFRSLGTQLVCEAMYYPFAVLDGIGGIDLLIPQYRSALGELLNSDLPCIGAIRSEEECSKLRKMLGLTERFSMLTDNMRKVLAEDKDTLILNTTGKGDTAAFRILRQWAEEYA